MSTVLPLPEKITRDYSREVTHRTLEASFGDGLGQYAANGVNSKGDNLSLIWAPLTATERDTVMTALDSVGGHGTLLYTLPLESTQKKFRLAGGKYTVDPVGNAKFKISASLIQRFESWA